MHMDREYPAWQEIHARTVGRVRRPILILVGKGRGRASGRFAALVAAVFIGRTLSFDFATLKGINIALFTINLDRTAMSDGHVSA